VVKGTQMGRMKLDVNVQNKKKKEGGEQKKKSSGRKIELGRETPIHAS